MASRRELARQMRSQLLSPSGPCFWASRGGALVAILALHGLAAAVVMLARSAPPDQPRLEPMLVTLLSEQRSEPSPAPRIPLQEVRLPAPVIPVIPVVTIDLHDDSPPVAITVATAAEPSPAPSGDATAPIMATTVEYVRPPLVVYPVAAKRAHASGTVQVRALVETDGQVRDVRVHRSSGFELLDRAACDAVRGALFKPYTLNGAPRSALVVVPIYFNLVIRTARR